MDDTAVPVLAQATPLPTNPRFRDLTGERFGRLVVVGFAGMVRSGGRWVVRCDCGTTKVTAQSSLARGTRSCGCLTREATTARNYRHGLSRHPAYDSWVCMMDRCFGANRAGYHRYGGRGITVCRRWQHPSNFIADMGDGHFAGAYLDRIDNDGNYEPGNVRWVTSKRSARNRSTSRYIEHDGERLLLVEWAERIGGRPHNILNRIHRLGWTMERAITEPVRHRIFTARA